MVPRPPFMLGLANKTGSKVWERRIKLHKLIEGHINRLKEEYNFTNPTVAGVFELQGVISQLSQDCINKRDQLMVCVCVCVSACVFVCMCRRERRWSSWRKGGAAWVKHCMLFTAENPSQQCIYCPDNLAQCYISVSDGKK